MKKVKHYFSYLKYIVVTIYKTMRKKWFWITLAWLVSLYIVAWFNSNYEIKALWKFGVYPRSKAIEYKVATVSAEMIEPTLTPTPRLSEKEYALSKIHGEVLLKIFERESNSGKKDMCRIKGIGYNGLGLGESDAYIAEYGPNCFKTYEALWDRAEKLIVDLGIDKDNMFQTAICRWKSGSSFNSPMCVYSHEVINITSKF